VSIAPTTCSCGLPGEGNQTWRAVRSTSTGSGAKRRDPSRTAKVRAVAKANPFRPRYAKVVAVNLPDMLKPVTCGEERSESTRGAIRGGGGRRVPKERSRNLGGPVQGPRQERAAKAVALWSRIAACGESDVSGSGQPPQPEPACSGQRLWGIHNPCGVCSRASERLIVAGKRGNARGAKGPYFSRVPFKESRND
jgi:hypothetical protein